MSVQSLPTPAAWTPIVQIDLATASSDAFSEALTKLATHAAIEREAGTLPVFPFEHDGWFDITPQMAETALMHSAGNREVSFTTVKAYAADMLAGDWQPTGETIAGSAGRLGNGHGRLLAGYLSQTTFRCFVVVSVPPVENLFAYYDSGKKRTAADALHIAGMNGAGKAVAQAISSMAIRYDHHKLGVSKQQRFRTPNSREVLAYAQQNQGLSRAAHVMLGSFPAAVDVIRSKPAAIFFAWLVLRTYDDQTLQSFCTPLGSGALLEEDSPLLAVRAKLMEPEDPTNKKPDRTRLAYLCKAFLMFINQQRMPRTRGRVQPLGLHVDEPFPRIDPPITEQAAA